MHDTRAGRVDHLCILALAVEWIVFGSCHFTFQAATKAEIPNWILSSTHLGSPFMVGVIGMIEVTTGIPDPPAQDAEGGYADLAGAAVSLSSIDLSYVGF